MRNCENISIKELDHRKRYPQLVLQIRKKGAWHGLRLDKEKVLSTKSISRFTFLQVLALKGENSQYVKVLVDKSNYGFVL